MNTLDSMSDFRQGRVGREAFVTQENPTVQYEIQEPVARMVEARAAVDEKARVLLERVAADEMYDGMLDIEREWECWLAMDKHHSCMFFDSSLEVFGDEAYRRFMKLYEPQRKEIVGDLDEIFKMGQRLDEYAILKTAIYNVFNNRNCLPLREYLEQIFDRAPQYGMVVDLPGRGEMNLTVHFNPLADVNRGGRFCSYQLRMGYNKDYRKDGYVYSVQMMDARSADSMYVGLVDLPVLGRYEKFEERMNDHFLNTEHSLFHFDAIREKRVEEKEKYNIPDYYFEATFLDSSKLVNFSKKSYQYGRSSVFIPKSQVAWAGDKLYVNKWLYYKLKDEVEAVHEHGEWLDEKLDDAATRAEGRHAVARLAPEVVR